MDSCELFDPVSNKWSSYGAWPLPKGYDSSCILLNNGKILLAHLWDGPCELYDPKTRLVRATGKLLAPHPNGALVVLENGQVLVVGAYGPFVSPNCEIYDTKTEMWSMTGRTDFDAWVGETGVNLPNAKVLFAGGVCYPYVEGRLAEVYDPVSKSWKRTGRMTIERTGATVTPLESGEVLVAGGTNGIYPTLQILCSSELYNPVTNQWRASGNMNQKRVSHVGLLVENGQVLVIGGEEGKSSTSCELYDPRTEKWSETGSLNIARTDFSATVIAKSKVLVVGGRSIDGTSLSSCEIYDILSGKWVLQ